jgi:hypothetical protein
MPDIPEEPPLKFFCISLYYYDSPTPEARIQHWVYNTEEDFTRNFTRLVKRHTKLVKPYKFRLIAEEAIAEPGLPGSGKWVETMRWDRV